MSDASKAVKTAMDKFKVIETTPFSPTGPMGPTGSYGNFSFGLKSMNSFKTKDPLTKSVIKSSGILGNSLPYTGYGP